MPRARIDVRLMDRSDRERVLSWHRELYTDVAVTSRRHYVVRLSRHESRKDGLEALRLGRRLRGIVLIAELDRRPVGYLIAHVAGFPDLHHLRTRRPNLEGYIVEALVEKGARRRGVGAALFRDAERRLKTLGCDNIQLGVSADNLAARKFYRELGFGEFGLRLRKDVSRPPNSWAGVRSKRAQALRRAEVARAR